MVADVFDQLHLALALVLPIVDVIDGVLLLEPLEQGLVLLSDSLRLLISYSLIQRLCNVLASAASDRLVIVAANWHLFDLVGRDGRHVSFLVLREVLTGPRQDAGHAFEQHTVGFLNLRASI